MGSNGNSIETLWTSLEMSQDRRSTLDQLWIPSKWTQGTDQPYKPSISDFTYHPTLQQGVFRYSSCILYCTGVLTCGQHSELSQERTGNHGICSKI